MVGLECGGHHVGRAGQDVDKQLFKPGISLMSHVEDFKGNETWEMVVVVRGERGQGWIQRELALSRIGRAISRFGLNGVGSKGKQSYYQLANSFSFAFSFFLFFLFILF